MKHTPASSKITPPRLPHVLQRARLLERLEENREKKLILILGQAAQGKSTLAAAYVKGSERPCAWLNLDKEESAAVNLFTLLVQSVQSVLRDVDLSPALNCPSLSLIPREEAALFRDWVRSLFSSISCPLQMVFDGLDRLSLNHSSGELLRVLVDELPENLHLLMLSREMPPFDFQTRQVRQEAHLVNNEELAFTLDEIRDFFSKVRGLSLPPERLQKIHRVTEGWVGGLILLAESLDQRAGDAGVAVDFDELPDHYSKEVFRYFGEEIFSSQPRNVQECLIKSSIADTIDPELLGEVTGNTGARAIFHDLAARNLFVHSFHDKQKGWLFRCHQLFRDFLQTKFQVEMDEEARRTFYLKAGLAHEHRQELEEAVKYYLQAKAYPRAEHTIQKTGMDLLKQGRSGDLARWVASLPEDLVQANPWLLFYHFMSGRLSAAQAHLLSLHKAFALFQEQQDLSGLFLSLAYLIEASIIRGHPSIPRIHTLLAQGETLLQSTPLDEHPYERAVLWSQIGFAHSLRSGNPRKGYWACSNAYQLGEYLGDVPLQINALIHSHGALSILGEFARSDQITKRVEKLLDKCASPELRIFHYLNIIQLELLRGDLQRAEDLLESTKQQIARHGLTNCYPPAAMFEVWLKGKLRAYDESVDLGTSVTNLALAMGNSYMYGNGLLQTGLSLYQKGDYGRAREHLESAREVFSSEEARTELHLNLVRILLSLISCRLQQQRDPANPPALAGTTKHDIPPNPTLEKGGRGDFHLKDLQEPLEQFQEAGCTLFLKEAHLAMALGSAGQDRVEDAVTHLGAGLKIMQERGYDQVQLLNQEDFLRICTLALELQVGEVRDYAEQLLATKLAAVAEGALRQLARHPVAEIAGRASRIRREILRSAMPRVRIQTLGAFQVTRNLNPVEEKEWPANQPKLLLKALVARGSRNVPKDLLMEDLWPEAASLSAERSFKVILHRLRKVLEPQSHEEPGLSYIHLKANLVSLDPELCHVDVDEFLALLQEGERKESGGDIKGALDCYREAEKCYRGDFLPEELYTPWVDLKREELRTKYLRLLARSATLYERRGTLTRAIRCYRKMVETDPLLEEAYRKLMLLYSNSQMTTAALRVYEDCRKALRGGLDLEPDELTSAIHRKILTTCSR